MFVQTTLPPTARMYFALMWVVIGATLAAPAPTDPCPDPNMCAVSGPQLPLHCQGSIIKNTGLCGCTDECAMQLGESCQAASGMFGRITFGTCEPGLECVPHGEMVMLGYGRCQTPRIRKAADSSLPDSISSIFSAPHNTPCEQQRRARLMSMVVWRGQWVPVCDSHGDYVPHQCDNMGQCFCVEPVKGTVLTAKRRGTVDCSDVHAPTQSP